MATLRKVLVANRGEIAVRVIRACREEGIRAVAVASDADMDSLAVREADEVVGIGPATATSSYLNVGAIVGAALLAGCDAVHPGYGFLSEQPELVEACDRFGLTFVGPSADTIRAAGDKLEARQLARDLGVPLAAGTEAVSDPERVAELVAELGLPVLIKAAAGGGGRGMRLVRGISELAGAVERARAEALAAFGDDRLYVERYVEQARHVEVQILGDTHGTIVHLGDRDCSYQRRYQKVAEEAPASAIPDNLRASLWEAARTLMGALGYVGAGTVEFLVDVQRGTFAFLEINTRVQVEHPVTEMITGLDIVREQLRIAAGEPLSFGQDDVVLNGHALEFRVNAESPERGFLPTPGLIEAWDAPSGPGIRVDTHCFAGYTVPAHYDSLLAKLVVWAQDRPSALARAEAALADFRVTGVETTLGLHRALIQHPDVRENSVSTRWLEETFLPSWSQDEGEGRPNGLAPAVTERNPNR
ncbi:MAG: acetyl-CoA carboxylase biotin carboxylase subunit [Acidimicrobiia bacterium]|uniref:acetyl-CoA carboxylase biotin carboxylase subunit n=1 Tax=Nocardioides sp. Soil777 TaxID=1736409 RepID=UPI0009EC2761|nr:acetyl-CoA carboxylase biotin carboxylase subunit [Nocardioides sp. Soil777]MDP3983699.1 acetyl-CoA carboxylase biotin carboxylase subunit [Acidimicrobiia bacterium]